MVTLVVGTNTYATLEELITWLRDRVFAELLGVDVVSPAATYATLTTGSIKWTSKDVGSIGNGVSVAYINSGADESLSITSTYNDIIVNLATDSEGVITTTYADILELTGAFENIATAALITDESPTDLVSEMAATNLSNGTDVSSVTTDEKLKQYLVMAYDAISNLKFTDVTTTTVETVVTPTEWVKNAQCWEVVYLYAVFNDPDILVRLSLQLQGVDQFTFGRTQHEEFKKRPKRGGLYSPEAFKLLSPHLIRTPAAFFQTI